eukprot:TRINITY_DN668_c0_g1_i1.p1 TRINITY_DN668_c0_g1~~TRINITY_DN668_c0_g1_i1.p1  ORF type:complete len:250 (-),score=80.64 TRINITY_DN668_c0_g1_i1:23-697(-)
MSLARMSMWSTKFEEPLTSKQEIDSIRNTPEYDRKVNVPIKAALKTASCSMFKDPILTRFINMVQEHSNGMKGETILLETCRRIKEIQLEKYYKANPEKRDDIERNPMVIMKGAIENCRPVMQLEKVKVGSVNYQVPTPISESRSYFESMRWIHQTGRWDRDTGVPGKNMNAHKKIKPRITIADGLAKECVDAFYHQGKAMNTMYEHHKSCEQNRAYAHYRRTK